jgi:hypothetical protein
MHGAPFHCVEYAKDDAPLRHEPPQNYAQELSYPVNFHLFESDDETTPLVQDTCTQTKILGWERRKESTAEGTFEQFRRNHCWDKLQ